MTARSLSSYSKLRRRSGSRACRMWFLSLRIRWNKLSSISSMSSVSVRISERHSPERTPRRITASTRCRSTAVANQALAAYVSWRRTCLQHIGKLSVSSWHMPCARSVLIACTDCAHEPTIFCTWSVVTDRQFVWYGDFKHFHCRYALCDPSVNTATFIRLLNTHFFWAINKYSVRGMQLTNWCYLLIYIWHRKERHSPPTELVGWAKNKPINEHNQLQLVNISPYFSNFLVLKIFHRNYLIKK